MSGVGFTFDVHPRPTSDDPNAVKDAIPAAAIAALKPTPALEEDNREWDTFLGNLAFLVRYAFGRY